MRRDVSLLTTIDAQDNPLSEILLAENRPHPSADGGGTRGCDLIVLH
jgi:hypothetical protein